MVKKKATEVNLSEYIGNEAKVTVGEIKLSGTATAFEPTVETKPLDDPSHDPVAVEAVKVADAFIAWAKGDDEDDTITAYIQAGFLDETFYNLTDTGVALLEAEGVAWGMTNFIVLGVPLSFSKEGRKRTIEAGSIVRVLSGGFDGSRASEYWECFAGSDWPIVRVYKHRQHQFMQKPFPAAKPLT